MRKHNIILKLRDTVQLFFQKESFDIVSAPLRVVFRSAHNPFLVEQAFKSLKKGLILKNINPNEFNKKLAIEIANHLSEDFTIHNAHSKTLIPDQYLRNFIKIESMMGDANEARKTYSKLLTSRIAVLGVGSLGSHILQNLSVLGVKNFVLIDSDVVEASNLNRQILFSEADIGKKKVSTARKYLKSVNPAVDVTEYYLEIQTAAELSKILTNIDFLFVTADRPFTKIAALCAEACKDIPWVRINRNGYGPFATRKSACANCHYLSTQKRVKNYSLPEEISLNKSLGVFNSDISFRVSLLLRDYINFLTTQEKAINTYCRIVLPSHMIAPTIKYEKIKKYRDCPCSN